MTQQTISRRPRPSNSHVILLAALALLALPTAARAQWTQPNSGSITTNNNVGIGMTSPAEALDVVGNIAATGNIAAKFQHVAEWVPSVQKLAAGTVVVLDAGRVNHVVASGKAYDTAVAGVVSAKPGLILDEGGEGNLKVATTGASR